MKKVLILLMFLLNLLPNISKNGMEIGFSTISAQTFGNEGMAYLCEDEEIGYYLSPLPCDEEVCISPCTYPGCMLSFPCDDLYYHMTFDHEDGNTPVVPRDVIIPQDGTGETGTTSNSSPKQRAINIINQFAKDSSTPTLYPYLSKDKFVQSLKVLVNNPSLVRQGQNGTCGAAIICKLILEDNPELYVRYATELYKYGTSKFATNSYLQLPSSAFQGNDEQLATINTSSADALVQGGIINWGNEVLSYDPFTDGSGPSSAMFPRKLKEFLTKTGYEVNCVGDTFMGLAVGQLSFEQLTDSSIDYHSDFIIGYVYSTSIPNYYNFDNNVSSHYAQLLSVDKERQKIHYWSWGKEYYSANSDGSTGVGLVYIVKRK